MKKTIFVAKLAVALCAMATTGLMPAPAAKAQTGSGSSSSTVTLPLSFVKQLKGAKNLATLEKVLVSFIAKNPGTAGLAMQAALSPSTGIQGSIKNISGFTMNIIQTAIAATAASNSAYVANVTYYAAAGSPGDAARTAAFAAKTAPPDQAATISFAAASGAPGQSVAISTQVSAAVSGSFGAPPASMITMAATAGSQNPGAGANITGGSAAPAPVHF